MRSIITHIIFFLFLSNANFIFAQTANSNINPDSINITFLESLVKTKIDSVRLKNKRKILVINDTLKKAADDQAMYMMKKKNLTHFQDNPKKKEVDDRIKFYGMKKSKVGENINYTFIFTPISNGKKKTYVNTTYEETANDITKLWVNSKGHFENMIDPDYYYTAVAISYDKKLKRVYAVQDFSSE